jgi:RNA polymerase sigma factor (sigma-70 family)
VARNRTSPEIAQLLRAVCAHEAEGQTDGQLLGQFLDRRDEAAFAALVRRHGPMVLSVCRRALGNTADTEDAFQATFLVLVRKAASLTARAALGDWLHGVARRTASNAKRGSARRRAKERAMARPEAQGEEVRDDWLPLLDEELGRLPEKYRLPIVLCDLEGRTRREAAGRLGWPEGTVAGRLARGRARLARQLARHGLALPAGSLAAVLSQQASSACVPAALGQSTAKAASLLAAGSAATAGVISAEVAGLTEGVVRAMFLSKLKTAAALVLLVSALAALGYGGLVRAQPNGKAEGAEKPAAKAEDDPQGPGGLGKDPPRAEPQKVDPKSQARIEERKKALPEGGRAAAGADQDPDLELGLKVEGEINQETNKGNPGGEGHLIGYRVVVPITLKAGSNISASATVVGRRRAVGLMLKDPTGKILGSSKMDPRTAQIRVEEVNANGKYTIEVYSDLIGPFTLWAADTTDELDKKMLEEKINQLEKELAELRKKLKAKENKKPQ